jgi:putative ABC transport system permease protein
VSRTGGARNLGLPSLIRQSLLHRRARSLSALIALTVSAAVATALLTLFADLNAKLHHQFRSFGANIVLTGYSGPGNLAALGRQAAGPSAAVAAFAYAVAQTDRGTPVVVAGVDFPAVRRLDSWWQVPQWPSAPDQALLGERAAQFVGNERAVTLTFAGKSHTFVGAGHVKTGGDEDSRIYVSSAALADWTGVRPSVLEVQIPGGADEVNAALLRLRSAFPDVSVTPVRQLVDGESRIVDRTHALLYAAALLIVLTVTVSVLATLSASVLERRRDFALMKALGGQYWELTRLFLLETLILSIGGVVAGYLVGSLAAFVISELNFHTATLPRISVLVPVLLLNVLIAAAAAFFPVRSLRALEPATLLKGE